MTRIDRLHGMSRPATRPGIVLGALALLIAIGIWSPGAWLADTAPRATPGDPAAVATAIDLGNAFASVAEEAQPAVVTITSERVVATAFAPEVQAPRGFFDDFFRRFQPNPSPREYRQRGLGSGFIISSDGIVLTCNHVVQDAQEVKVILPDESEFEAEVVGTDPKTDVAVLRVKADRPLPSLRLGDSDAMRVGEWVLAMGNPFSEGLRGSVTAGIVSAKGRSRMGLTDYEDFLQTDAAINPGNSGGPLVNLKGEVVGINSAIAGRSGGSQGVGFAIPINLAKRVEESILSDGRVVRGWLGIYLGELTPELRDAFKIGGDSGVLVQQVMPDSPAEKAGFKDGDVILELNGRPVQDMRDLRFRIAEMRPGTEVALTFLRDGERRSATAVLEELPSENEPVAQGESQSTLDKLGFAVSDLNAEWRGELQLNEDAAGVVVTDVQRASPAADEGLQPGDVIIEVGREPIRSAAGFLRAVREVPVGEVVLLTVVTDTTRRFVAIRMPE
jgi:serine protease Do